MPTSLITFYTPQFRYSKNLLVKSAKKAGINNISVYNNKDFEKTSFYKQHLSITSQSRGAGYWLWKPYYILEHLKKAKEGDIILYCDSGLKIEGDIAPLVHICKTNQQNKGVLLFHNYQCASYISSGFKKTDEVLHHESRKNKYWGKRDVFILMDADNEANWNSMHLEGCLMLLKKTSFSVAFIEEWLKYCCVEDIITDKPNTQGLPNHENFIMHIHDQVILSLLAFRHGLELYRCPSQFGNHKKMERYRHENEFIMVPYTNPELNSNYDTLFLHHRIKKMPFLKQYVYDLKQLKGNYINLLKNKSHE